MPELTNHHAALLLLMTFLPAVTGIVIAAAVPAALARTVALAGAVLTFLVSLTFVGGIFGMPADFTAAVNIPWIERYNVALLMGLDGLSGSLVLLTNVLIILAVLGSWTAIAARQKEFYFYLLLLQTGILGAFLALDLLLFYIFWEIMLIPLYFLIGIFGSKNRIYATTKFFLYTMAGSLLMLLGIIALYFHTGSFALADALGAAATLDPTARLLIFLSFVIAFAIKVPLFPLHTWLPDAHTEAPTAGSVVLAGVLLKTGVYGLLRFAIPLFPAEAARIAPLMMLLAVIAIIYGALTAFAQRDMKRLVAYSSVSHMGFIVLGVFAFREAAITGASLQMINHGISTSGLFLCVGYLYERRHTRELAAFGGLAHNMKLYAVLTMIMILSSVGLPGLNGFVGEFMILVGAYPANAVLTIIAATGVILAACYLLRLMQETFYGPLDKDENKVLRDLNPRESFTLVVLAVFALWIGLYPRTFTEPLAPVSERIVRAVEAAQSPGSALADATAGK
ncbi:MAG TPA: NADH-quinone oxidoreductase subunit M [Candidatus Sumerlaeota bacterium]|nr:NADH-quinone oxidoreductase subunit M [Candidatus Sumerlaeota bacterium]